METLIKKVSKNYTVAEHAVRELLKEMQEYHFSKGDCIVDAGNRNTSLYILKKGIWRASRHNQSGEFTFWFATEATLAFSIWGYANDAPSEIRIESETDSTAYGITKRRLDDLCTTSIEIANLTRLLFEQHTLFVENDILFLWDKKDATERYLSLLKEFPELLQNVPLKKLASYLFVTPQSLSRIRAGLKNKR